jgi:hypothetical protein
MEYMGECKDLFVYKNLWITVIGSFNSKVGAVILNSQYFIISANQFYVFTPPMNAEHLVQLCFYSWYGNDDLVQWPQLYISDFCYLGAIPQLFAFVSYQIMWWMLNHSNFSCHQSLLSLILDLKRLFFEKLFSLKWFIKYLFDHIKRYQAAMPDETHPQTWALLPNG